VGEAFAYFRIDQRKDTRKPYSNWWGVRYEWMGFELLDGIFREGSECFLRGRESLSRIKELELFPSNRLILKYRYLTARAAFIELLVKSKNKMILFI